MIRNKIQENNEKIELLNGQKHKRPEATPGHILAKQTNHMLNSLTVASKNFKKEPSTPRQMNKSYENAPNYFNNKKVRQVAREFKTEYLNGSIFEPAPLPKEVTSIPGVGHNEHERLLSKRLKTEMVQESQL